MKDINKNLKTVVQRLNIYDYLKYRAPFLYDIYMNFNQSGFLKSRALEINFYKSLGLKPEDMVFDVGANKGDKADIFLRIGTNVIAIDPDKTNIETLNKRFWKHKNFQIIEGAVGEQEGKQIFYVNTPGSAYNTLSPKWKEVLQDVSLSRFRSLQSFNSSYQVNVITLDKLIAKFGIPTLIKIDVEGYEKNVIKGLNNKVKYLSFELNLPEFLEEGLECISILSDLYQGLVKFNYVIDCQEGFNWSEWKNATDIENLLKSGSNRYMEVFCQMI
ncbi:MAG: FkbM family methyltransferase [Calothrix sp. MO_192.B10]|nr:FkbM family methyltransferase [Calothrix sp. MO_192.B10]